MVQELQGTMRGPEGEGGEFLQVDRRTYSYRYAGR